MKSFLNWKINHQSKSVYVSISLHLTKKIKVENVKHIFQGLEVI